MIRPKINKNKNIAYLALVEDVDGRASTAEDLGVVLVDGALRVADSGHIFNDDDVVRVLALSDRNALGTNSGGLVEEAVSVDHIIDDAALADLLALELPLSRQVVPVVVAEMVVRGDGKGLDSSVDEELGEDRFELGLAGLQVVTTDERVVTLSELDDTRNKGVLGSAIDEWLTLKNGRDSEESGRGDLGVGCLNGGKEVIGRIIDTRDDVTVTLSVGGPEDDDAVEAVLPLEPANVGTDVLEVNLLVGSRNDVVGASLLVGSDEVGIVNGGQRFPEKCHMGGDLALEVIVEDLGTLHSLVHGETGNVPTTKDEIIGVHHGQHVRDRDVNFLARTGLSSNANGGRTEDRANVVGLLDTGLGVPNDVVAVGEDRGAQGRAVVTTETDHQQTVK